MASRPTVKVDSLMFSHPAGAMAGDEALGLWLRCCCWLATYPKQGTLVPFAIAKHLGKRRQIAALVAADMWTEVEGGYRVYEGLDIRGCGWTDDMWSVDQNDRRKKIPDDLRAEVYERDEFACVVCGSSENLSLDHIIPWSKGGPDTFENFQTMCRSCNSSKGARV